ncbi:hypothetical protein ACQ5SO_13790 [Rhodovulum sp. DZ06]
MKPVLGHLIPAPRVTPAAAGLLALWLCTPFALLAALEFALRALF